MVMGILVFAFGIIGSQVVRAHARQARMPRMYWSFAAPQFYFLCSRQLNRVFSNVLLGPENVLLNKILFEGFLNDYTQGSPFITVFGLRSIPKSFFNLVCQSDYDLAR
jgi:hypothetical protein